MLACFGNCSFEYSCVIAEQGQPNSPRCDPLWLPAHSLLNTNEQGATMSSSKNMTKSSKDEKSSFWDLEEQVRPCFWSCHACWCRRADQYPNCRMAVPSLLSMGNIMLIRYIVFSWYWQLITSWLTRCWHPFRSMSPSILLYATRESPRHWTRRLTLMYHSAYQLSSGLHSYSRTNSSHGIRRCRSSLDRSNWMS